MHVNSQKTHKQIHAHAIDRNSHSPQFEKQFTIDYFFEEQQKLIFEVYDEDKPNTPDLTAHDLIGTCEIILGDLVHTQGLSCVD